MSKNIEYKLIKSEGLKRAYAITVPKGTIENEVIKRLEDIRKNTQIPGLAPDEVPMRYIRLKYQEQVVSDVVDELVNQNTSELFEAEGIRPASSPQVDVISFKTDEDLIYKVELEILPDVPLSDLDYNNISLEKPVLNIQEEDLNKRLEEIANQVNGEVNDELAVKLGLNNLTELRKLFKSKIEEECQIVARNLLKKQLFDILEGLFSFDLPEGMLNVELNTIREQLKESHQTSEDELKKLAKRRVLLGIVISEIARLEDISVTSEEINDLILREARNFPEKEQQIVDFYKENPQAFEALRGPILEEKVCNFIFEKVSIIERVVSFDEFKQIVESNI